MPLRACAQAHQHAACGPVGLRTRDMRRLRLSACRQQSAARRMHCMERHPSSRLPPRIMFLALPHPRPHIGPESPWIQLLRGRSHHSGPCTLGPGDLRFQLFSRHFSAARLGMADLDGVGYGASRRYADARISSPSDRHAPSIAGERQASPSGPGLPRTARTSRLRIPLARRATPRRAARLDSTDAGVECSAGMVQHAPAPNAAHHRQPGD